MDIQAKNEVNTKLKEYELIIERLHTDLQRERDRHGKELQGKLDPFKNIEIRQQFTQRPDTRLSIIAEKENEISQIRTEYVTLINQKNNYIRDKERENSELKEQVQDLKQRLDKLKDNEQVWIRFRIKLGTFKYFIQIY